MSYTEQLYKLMGESTFNHRGVEVRKLIGGYFCLNKKCLDMEAVDKIIDEAHGVIQKSIVK